MFRLRDPEWQPPDDLEEFLNAGPAPVYIGFGSMPSEDPKKIAGVVLDGDIKRTGANITQASIFLHWPVLRPITGVPVHDHGLQLRI